MVVYGPHEERERLGRVAELVGPKTKSTNDYYLPFICDLFGGGTARRTLPAMMASSGASNGACGVRRALAADASYALDVCRNNAVRRRACLAGDVGVVDSK